VVTTLTLPKPILDELDADQAGASLTTYDCASRSPAKICAEILDAARSLSADGRMLIVGSSTASMDQLCRLRDGLWPDLHVVRVYRWFDAGGIERIDVGGRRNLGSTADGSGFAVAALRRTFAMSPDVTTEKFDKNATGWNGDPGSPNYGHFRWMRRLIAACAKVRPGEAALDAGCGAGWVGIEAARMGARVSLFDPSPAMVRIVEENARQQGVQVVAKVGFVEHPPFDGPFDLVLDSGVISFAPDPEAFLDGLDRMVAPGGRLVIGDLNPLSAGMRRRRREQVTLPVRELNGLPREDVAERLCRRGYTISWGRYYQITSPVPELMHRYPSRLLCGTLLALNRFASAVDAACGAQMAPLFDSWILAARKGPGTRKS